jgi:hypothetical protein
METTHMPRLSLPLVAAFFSTLAACGTAPDTASAPAGTQGGEQAVASEAAPAVAAEPTSVDPVVASPDVFKVLLDGEHMRFLEATWQPGQHDNPHGHPALVAYAVTEIFGLGNEQDEEETQMSIRIRQGRAFLQPAIKSHSFENRAKAVAKMVIVELKEGHPMAPAPHGSVDTLTSSPGVYELAGFDTHTRVLLATWAPGASDKMHGHAARALYAITDVDGQLTDADDKSKPFSMKAGTAIFDEPAKAETFQNTGAAPAQLLIVESR